MGGNQESICDATKVSGQPPDAYSDQELSSVNPDAACDQCRSRKIRCGKQQPRCYQCSRSNLACSWMNKGRKLHHIADNLRAIEQRLAELAEGMQNVLQSVQRERPTAVEDVKRRTEILAEVVSMQQPSARGAASNLLVANTADPTNTGHLVTTSLGWQLYHGPTSLLSLLGEADSLLNARLQSKASFSDILDLRSHNSANAASWRNLLADKAKIFAGLSQTLAQDDALDLSNDSLPLMLPPKRLLDLVLEPYFAHINSVTPLLGYATCIRAIQEQYSNDIDKVDPAWVILFNYIIIRCFLGRYMPLERSSEDIDFFLNKEFELPFMSNIRRGFSCLSKLMRPQLANVQALIALTVIAQKYFTTATAAMCLHHACYVSRAIGLHRVNSQAQITCEESEERRRVYWGLYTIDKDLSFVLGITPCLPSFDCDLPLPEDVSPGSLYRIHYSLFTEKLYISLYSVAATRKSGCQIESDITRLEDDIQEALAPKDLTTILDEGEFDFLELESQYSYHHARLMLLRKSKIPERRAACHEEARKCIDCLVQMRRSKTTVAGYMALRRPFQWRPFVPFFQLLSLVFTDINPQSRKDDVKSLRTCVEVLRSIAWTDDMCTYLGTLLQVTEACLEVVELVMSRHLLIGSAQPSTNISTTRKRKHAELNFDERMYECPSGLEDISAGQRGARYPRDEQDSLATTVEATNSFDDFFGWPNAETEAVKFFTDHMLQGRAKPPSDVS